MIQVELGGLLQMIPSLDKLKKINNSSGRMVYKLSKIILRVQEQADAFDNAKLKMVKRYGIEDQNGGFRTDEKGNYYIKAQLKDEFNKEFNELLHTKIELNINKFSISDFDNLNLNAEQMLPLMPFIEDEE